MKVGGIFFVFFVKYHHHSVHHLLMVKWGGSQEAGTINHLPDGGHNVLESTESLVRNIMDTINAAYATCTIKV